MCLYVHTHESGMHVPRVCACGCAHTVFVHPQQQALQRCHSMINVKATTQYALSATSHEPSRWTAQHVPSKTYHRISGMHIFFTPRGYAYLSPPSVSSSADVSPICQPSLEVCLRKCGPRACAKQLQGPLKEIKKTSNNWA